MLNDLDDTIRELLIVAGGFDPTAVDVSFDIPTRDWSGKISRPTLNCYLFDIHERRILREEGWQIEGRGTNRSARRSPPLFFEISYLITAWTVNHQVDDEHRMLWRALETLMDQPVLPKEYLKGSLREYEWPIHTAVAQLEGVLKSPGEFWTALENQLKPSINYTVTLGRDRAPRPTDAPPVLSTGIRLRLPESTAATGFVLNAVFHVPPGASSAGVTVEARRILEGGEPAQQPDAVVTTDEDGRFRFDLPPGRYRLDALIGGEVRRRTVNLRDDESRRTGPLLSDVVHDQEGRPVPGVLIEVEGLGMQTVTDAQGRFSFDLPPGRYILRLQFDGWEQRRQATVREQAYAFQLAYGGVLRNGDEQ